MVLETDLNFITDLNTKKKTVPPERLISEFISKHRIMPPGTPFPGHVDLSLTPYAIEWMDNMSPYSTVQHMVLKKAAQIAATFSVENIIGYWMREYPTAIMYTSATDKLLEKWVTKRLESMIDSCGIRELIREQAEVAFGSKSRRTADKTYSKQFLGGFLEMVSAQSPAGQRSDSIRLLIRDETDGAPLMLKTGEGSYMKTTEARTKFWGPRKKIFDLSTPGLKENSYIDRAYEDGDKNLCMVPCPMCNKMQPLSENPEEGSFGLRGDTTAGVLTSVYYLCEFCHGAIFDTSKYQMFNKYNWEPTSISKSEFYKSYYINSMYAPFGTVSWQDYYVEWQDHKTSPEKEQGFINLWAGLSYEETGERPKIENVNHLRGTYEAGTVPDGVLFLTGAVDVQRGSEKYQNMTTEDLQIEIAEAKKKKKKKNFPRLEMEILGTGGGYRTWSICYKRFEGHIKDIESGAWELLTDFFRNQAKKNGIVRGEYKAPAFVRISDGHKFDIPVVFFDARDGEMTGTVYNYTQKFAGFYPSMGMNNKEIIQKKGDKEATHDKSRYKMNRAGQDLFVYMISTNYYKNKIYGYAKRERRSMGIQMPGFLDHPKQYDDHYFKMLFAEDKRKDGSFVAHGRRNEALDIKVYAMCAADVYIDMLIADWRKNKQEQGYSMDRCRAEIDTKWVLQYLENLANPKKKNLDKNEKTK